MLVKQSVGDYYMKENSLMVDNPVKLASLCKSIEQADSACSECYEDVNFLWYALNVIRLKEKRCACEQRKYEALLPSYLGVSQRIAAFLYVEQRAFDGKSESADNKSLRQQLRIAGALGATFLASAFPNPTTLIKTGAVWTSVLMNEGEYSKAMSRARDELDKICATVLGAYQLRFEEGRYFLRRGEWKVVDVGSDGRYIHYDDRLTRVGLDYSSLSSKELSLRELL